MENNNFYRKDRSNSKVELYRQKLLERNEHQNWIFDNYFGKPGGGAPLRDKNGNLITKMRSVADENLFLLESKDFSKGDNINSYYQERPLSKTFSPQSISQNIIPQIISNQQQQFSSTQQVPNHISFHSNEENKNNIPQNIQRNFNQNQYMQNYVPYPCMPVLIFPPNNYQLTPFPNYQQNPYQGSKGENFQINQQSVEYNNDTYNLNKSFEKKNIENTQINNIPGLADNKDPTSLKKLQQLQYKKELLRQIEEKKRRDEIQKKEKEKNDMLEEAKYQEYLRVKNEQQEQMELKRRNKYFKKQQEMNAQNESNVNLNSTVSNVPYNKNKDILNEKNNTNNQNEENPNLNLNLAQEAKNELEKLEQLKKNLDNDYKSFNESINSEFEKEKQKIREEYKSKYGKEMGTLFSSVNDDPIHFPHGKLYSEKGIDRVEDGFDQRNLIDFIFGKPRNSSQFPSYDKFEENEKIPSSFGYNQNSYRSKYGNLHSTSEFILNGSNITNKYIPVTPNNNFNNTNNNTLSISLGNIDNKLEAKSSFIQVQDSNQMDRRNEGNKNNNKMFDKLETIGEINKSFDDEGKIQKIENDYSMDLGSVKSKKKDESV